MDDKILKTLEENGGKLWEKNGMTRVYFNPETVMSMTVKYYKTGNIFSASVNGKPISNSEAYRALNCKFWFDLTDGQFRSKNTETLHSTATSQAIKFINSLKAKIS